MDKQGPMIKDRINDVKYSNIWEIKYEAENVFLYNMIAQKL